MKQRSLARTGFELVTKRTRKREFLDEMNLVVPWSELVGLIEPHSPTSKIGRPLFTISTMLRIHFMQQCFGLSDPTMEEALHDIPLYREFAKLDEGITRLPDESTPKGPFFCGVLSDERTIRSRTCPRNEAQPD